MAWPPPWNLLPDDLPPLDPLLLSLPIAARRPAPSACKDASPLPSPEHSGVGRSPPWEHP